MTVGTAGAYGTRDVSRPGTAASRVRPRRGVRELTGWGTTPGMLRVGAAALVVGMLAAGSLAVAAIEQHTSAAKAVAITDEQLSVDGEEIYQSLADADATASNAFLSGGLEPQADRDHYLSSVAQASTALGDASALAGTSSATAGDLRTLTNDLPLYTGLVETARTDNRVGFPVGAAYLRDASDLMRRQMLPAAQHVFAGEVAHLRTEQDAATSFPWAFLAVSLLVLGGLIRFEIYLARRTNRLCNIGLLVTTASMAALLGWTIFAVSDEASWASKSRSQGSAQVEALSKIRITAIQARDDEGLRLVARGNGGAFEQDFTKLTNQLTDSSPVGLVTSAARVVSGGSKASFKNVSSDVSQWIAVHKALAAADDSGDYTKAVSIATSNDPASAKTAFNRLDGDLVKALQPAQAAFVADARHARDAFGPVLPAVLVLTLAGAAAAVVGIGRRVGEYR